MKFKNIILQPLFLLLVLLISANTTFTSTISIGLASAAPALTRTLRERQVHILDLNNDGLEVKNIFIHDLSESADDGCYFNSLGHKICHLTERGIESFEDEQVEEVEEEEKEKEEKKEIEEVEIVKRRPAPYWRARQVSAPQSGKNDHSTTTTTTTSKDDDLKGRQHPVELLNRERRMPVPFRRSMYFAQRRGDVLTFMPDELEKESEVEEEQVEEEQEEEEYEENDEEEEEEDEYE